MGSEEIHQVQTKHPKYVTLFLKIPLHERFLVTFPSILSETWVKYSSAIPDLVCFVTDCSLYFLLLLVKLPLIFSYYSVLPSSWGKSSVSCEDWTDLIFLTNLSISSIMREKCFHKNKTVHDVELTTRPQNFNLYKNSTFVSPFIPFTWRKHDC